MGRLTRGPIRGVLLGAIAAAIVQSSSAVVALTIALVDAGILTFRSSLGVVLGANVGTTSTAWLISLRLTAIGPFFIVLGAILSLCLPALKYSARQRLTSVSYSSDWNWSAAHCVP